MPYTDSVCRRIVSNYILDNSSGVTVGWVYSDATVVWLLGIPRGIAYGMSIISVDDKRDLVHNRTIIDAIIGSTQSILNGVKSSDVVLKIDALSDRYNIPTVTHILAVDDVIVGHIVYNPDSVDPSGIKYVVFKDYSDYPNIRIVDITTDMSLYLTRLYYDSKRTTVMDTMVVSSTLIGIKPRSVSHTDVIVWLGQGSLSDSTYEDVVTSMIDNRKPFTIHYFSGKL